MRLIPAVLAAALVAVPPLSAQTDLYARLGATWSSTLVRDDILGEITVGRAIAPTLVLGAALPIGRGYRAGLEGAVSRGGFSSEDEAGTSTDLGSVTTLRASLGIDGPLAPGLRWRADLGGIRYSGPDEGIFARGGSPHFLAGAAVEYRRRAFSAADLSVAARYDYHRFSTDELEARGFSSAQGVHRVGLSVGLARPGR